MASDTAGRALKLVLIGDGESPHLLKWARALARQPELEAGLFVASSRGFDPAFDTVVAPTHRLALNTRPRHRGGNVGVLLQLPRLSRWLRAIQPDWLHAHYLTSHGTLAWLAQSWGGVSGHLVCSAWGSDILVAAHRPSPTQWLTKKVLNASALTTSDSHHMAARMCVLGARDVMVFPFGLERMPSSTSAHDKDAHLFFANRALEPLHDPLRVIDTFVAIAQAQPEARLVVANDGSLRAAALAQAQRSGLAARITFVGRLTPEAQDDWYRRAQWHLSLPRSDSVSVSVLEAMAHGCIPLLSDLPANRELVRDGDNGLVLGSKTFDDLVPRLAVLHRRADAIAQANRAWVQTHAMFEPCVKALVSRLARVTAAGASTSERTVA